MNGEKELVLGWTRMNVSMADPDHGRLVDEVQNRESSQPFLSITVAS